jgi:uncharacterized protein
VYEFFKSIGAKHIQFTPVVERIASTPNEYGLKLISPTDMSNAKVAEWSVNSIKYGQFITKVFDHWIRHDLGDIFIQTFENTLSKMLGEPGSLCVFEPECGNAIALEMNGDAYSCDHFVFPENKIGNVNEQSFSEIIYSPQAIKFGQNKKTNISSECKKCPYLDICNGGCPKHRFEISENGIPNKNYFCDGYKNIYSHIGKYVDIFEQAFKHGLDAEHIKRQIKQQ